MERTRVRGFPPLNDVWGIPARPKVKIKSATAYLTINFPELIYELRVSSFKIFSLGLIFLFKDNVFVVTLAIAFFWIEQIPKN